jgi:hypothetical protein
MKKITIFLFVMLFSGFVVQSYGISVPVTFQVDMSNQFVSPNGVHIAGMFDVAWNPAEYEMTDEGGGIYSITFNLSIGTTVEYKFINGNGWDYAESVPGECAVNGNRFVNVSSAVTLDPVCFGTCAACEPASMVTLNVNMANKDVTSGVFVAGSFQGWNPGATPMTLMEDAYYSVTIIIPIGQTIEYKFVNNGDDWENVPACCNLNGNRYFTVPDEDVSVDAICFGSCFDCTEAMVDITFQVDMSNEEVSPDGVHVTGSFQGWDPAGTLMTDAGNGVYYHTASIMAGSCVEYKFINGTTWDDAEGVPEECSLYTNRYIEPFTNQILNPVCFGSCEGCEGGTSDLFMSEYAEGGSNNKYIELFNGTGSDLDLSIYTVKLASNGGDWGNSIQLEGVLADGDVYVIANSSSVQYIKDRADVYSTVTYFNGNDALALFKNDVVIDVFGVQGEDVYWSVAGVSSGGKDHTLVRKENVCSPNTDWASSAGTDASDSEWIVLGKDDFSNLGFHVASCGGAAFVEMPAFSVPGGLFLNPFDVEITCATPDAVIYYTTDGSDPDFNSTAYTGLINIAGITTVKAIAYAPGYAASIVAEVTYQFPIELTNLAELRAAANAKADYYKLINEVFITFQQDWRGQKYIEDESAAILIDDGGGVISTEYLVGDGITGIIGTVAEYGNMLQFTPTFDPGPATSSGTFITPQNISLNQLFSNFEEYEAELVMLEEIVFADAGNNFVNGWTFEMSDDAKATGDFKCTFYDVDYIGTPIPGERLAVVGLPNSNFNGDYLTSRDLNDFVNYTYPTGWTGISSNVIPEGSAAMEDVLAEAIEDMVILVGIDGIFWPGEQLNTIGDWDTYKGYKIKFASNSAFQFEGIALEDRTVEVEPGISYIPVLSEEAVAVEDLIVPLGDAIEFMFDIRFGLIYWPSGGILPGSSPVSLDMLYPGFAYLTRANSTVIIDYNVDITKTPASLPGLNVENKTPWNNVVRTGDQHIISIMDTDLLEIGDVIGTFSADGTCTGMSTFTGYETVLPLVVYADDQTTLEPDGMISSEVITMKIYRDGEVIDLTPVYNTNFENHDGLFTLNGLSVISELKLGATGVGEQNATYSIYPNPGNGLFTIQIDGNYSLTVSNAHGQRIMTANINGNYTLDMSNQPNGIYFIHMTNETSTLIEKVIIR